MKNIPSTLKYYTLLLFVLISFGVLAQKPIKTDTPNWVEEKAYTAIFQEEDQSGYYYLLSDTQVNAISKEYYARIVVQVLNSEGVAQLSDLTFEFDPEYEQLFFHKMDVIRDGERINKLDVNTIQTVQRESNLERKLYDGRLTSLVNLIDIRVGDILDYSYTIRGGNPVYEGDYGLLFNMQYGIPFGSLHYRIVTDKNETPKFDYKYGAEKPAIKTIGDRIVYEWSKKEVPAKFYDTNTPSWFDDYPRVYISTHGSWDDIVKQYGKLYQLSKKEKAQLSKLANQSIPLQRTDIEVTKASQIEQLIDFVQDDIRYFGFENGLSSHTPESPLKILNQRYGDCKGKSLLLVGLLENIGIEAYPMLVSTSNGETIGESMPSPNLFNHCVVNYSFEGKDYYIDPTISNQGGGIANRSFPNYKKGLVLKPGQDSLVTIPYDEDSGIEIQEIYDLNEINGGGSLTIVTTYNGSDADNTRGDFARRSNASIQKGYVQFYSSMFPTIEADDKITTEDFRGERNQFIVREKYTIDSLWQKSSENDKLLYFEIYPLAFEEYTSVTKSPARTAPYFIGYPASISYDISVNLPEEWSVEATSNTVESDYFTYDYAVESYLNKVLVTHNYSRKTDFVPVEDVQTYITQHEEIRNDLSYFLTYNQGLAEGSDDSGISWAAMVLALLTLGFSGYGAYKLYVYYDVEPRVKDVRAKPIGGWLVIVAIGLVLTPLVLIITLVMEEGFYDAYTWATLWNTEGIQGKPNVILIAMELVINLVRIVFSTVLIVLFFERRSSVPRLMVILYASTLAFIVIDAIFAYAVNGDLYTSVDDVETVKDIFTTLVAAAIWIPYFLISDRVKNTFVNRSKGYEPPKLESVNSEVEDIFFKEEI